MRIAGIMLLSGAAVIGSLAASAGAVPVPLIDFKAADYNATSGVWTDSSGNGDNATAPPTQKPTLLAGQTPNGSSVVHFTGGQILNLATALNESPAGNGFTAFAYLRSDGSGNSKTIISAGPTAAGFQYRIGGDSLGEVQELIRQAQANLGHSTTVLTATAFHNIDVAANGTSGAFRTDGAANGTASGSNFAGGISAIGSANGGEAFVGDIAEIRVYAGILSAADIQTVEQQLNTTYAPEPGSIALLAIGAVGLLTRRRRM